MDLRPLEGHLRDRSERRWLKNETAIKDGGNYGVAEMQFSNNFVLYLRGLERDDDARRWGAGCDDFGVKRYGALQLSFVQQNQTNLPSAAVGLDRINKSRDPIQ